MFFYNTNGEKIPVKTFEGYDLVQNSPTGMTGSSQGCLKDKESESEGTNGLMTLLTILLLLLFLACIYWVCKNNNKNNEDSSQTTMSFGFKFL